MVVPNSSQPPQSVVEVPGTNRLPNALTEILASRFGMVHEDGGTLLTEKRAVRGLQYFLAHLTSGVDPVPILERLLGFDQDRMVHLLHLLFSVQVGLYTTARRLFSCQG